jgi:adenylosuccinate synthase
MNKKAVEIRDLGPGDGGKGGVVHKASIMMQAHTILKVGGAQGSHGVRTSKGHSFNFSQWGCGTFEGVRTHITDQMVINPIGIINEGDLLKYGSGISDAYDLLTIDGRALATNPYHGIASRLTELAAGTNPRGTIGTGAGTAMLDAQLYPDMAIYARDLGLPGVRDKLAASRNQKREELLRTMVNIAAMSPEDRALAAKDIALLESDEFFEWILGEFRKVAERVRIVDEEHFREILSQDGNIIIESSHGILTDRFYGFHPHVSKLRTLPKGVSDMLSAHGYDGEHLTLGIFRAYNIRHGAGPMVSHDPHMSEQLLPGSSKDENRWQGKVRVGPIDFVALRYAIDVCGGPQAFRGLAVTWFDQIRKNSVWNVCKGYTHTEHQQFFTPQGGIRVWQGENQNHLRHQQELGHRLALCKPIVTRYEVPETEAGCVTLCRGVIEEQLGIPVRMISLGPTEQQKICL